MLDRPTGRLMIEFVILVISFMLYPALEGVSGPRPFCYREATLSNIDYKAG
jgi:hypothetical protein